MACSASCWRRSVSDEGTPSEGVEIQGAVRTVGGGEGGEVSLARGGTRGAGAGRTRVVDGGHVQWAVLEGSESEREPAEGEGRGDAATKAQRDALSPPTTPRVHQLVPRAASRCAPEQPQHQPHARTATPDLAPTRPRPHRSTSTDPDLDPQPSARLGHARTSLLHPLRPRRAPPHRPTRAFDLAPPARPHLRLDHSPSAALDHLGARLVDNGTAHDEQLLSGPARHVRYVQAGLREQAVRAKKPSLPAVSANFVRKPDLGLILISDPVCSVPTLVTGSSPHLCRPLAASLDPRPDSTRRLLVAAHGPRPGRPLAVATASSSSIRASRIPEDERHGATRCVARSATSAASDNEGGSPPLCLIR